MKIGIFIKKELEDEELSTFLISKISEHGFDFDQENPDVVIFVGGDGTLLRAVHEYIEDIDNISFLGIHQGRLGFYTGYTLEEIDEALSDLENDDYRLQTTRLIEARVASRTVYAVNEVRLENPFHTFTSDVYINDELLETFRGNGLVISSSNGSSAYNKSLGGAVISPELETLQLTEIAPINNRVTRSLNSSFYMNIHLCIFYITSY